MNCLLDSLGFTGHLGLQTGSRFSQVTTGLPHILAFDRDLKTNTFCTISVSNNILVPNTKFECFRINLSSNRKFDDSCGHLPFNNTLGPHTVSIQIVFSDGSTAVHTASYNILRNGSAPILSPLD